MEFFQTAVLGLVQGITEFLPISSSGHLILIQKLFGWQETRTSFTAAVHLGTLIASITVFRGEIWGVVERFFKTRNKLTSDVAKVILTSIPVLAVGYLVRDIAERLESPLIIALMLILLGLIFLFFPAKPEKDTDKELPSWKTTFLVSLAQILAFLPGTSRSGATILVGRAAGLSFSKVLYTSFIISIPVIAAAGLWGLISETNAHPDEILPFVIGLITSLISGYLAGMFLRNKLPKIGLRPFGVYRIALGSAILISQLFF